MLYQSNSITSVEKDQEIWTLRLGPTYRVHILCETGNDVVFDFKFCCWLHL